MNDEHYEEKRHGLTIKIYQDDINEGPDSWEDKNLFLVGYHREFSVDAPKIDTGRLDQNKKKVFRPLFEQRDLVKLYDPDPLCPHCKSDATEQADGSFSCDYCEEGAAIPAAEVLRPGPEVFQPYHVFGLEAYIHSGVVLALAGSIRAAQFPDRRWDVSLVGAVLVSREEWPDPKEAANAAGGLVDLWNDHLCGNVFGFVIQDAAGNDVESIWGFYGDYDGENGALAEARRVVDALTHNGKTDHKGQNLLPWAPETQK